MKNMFLPAKYTATVQDKQELTPSITGISLKTEGQFNFKPGQFINLEVGESSFRSYSIATPSPDMEFIELAVLTGRPGLGADYVRNLEKGASVSFIGPSGRFFYRQGARKNVVFIATSTGVAPFIPMIKEALNDPLIESVKLLFGVRSQKDVFYENYFTEFASSGKFDHIYCLSVTKEVLVPPFFVGRVTDHLKNYLKEGTDYYLCGNPNMIGDAISIIESAGLKNFSIYHESFHK